MGKRAHAARSATRRTIRKTPLSQGELEQLRSATYEGNPQHKSNPGDFGLTPPRAPHPAKTLCDEAGISQRSVAEQLLALAVERAVVSEATTPDGFPKQIWAVDSEGRVFEGMHGGVRPGAYHGYPVRRSDPTFQQVLAAWKTD